VFHNDYIEILRDFPYRVLKINLNRV
jgi:hypothetical protein